MQKATAWGVRMSVACVNCHERIRIKEHPSLANTLGMLGMFILLVVVFLSGGEKPRLLYFVIYAGITLVMQMLYRYIELRKTTRPHK